MIEAQEPECLMSLMPIRGNDGEVAVDIGNYYKMSPLAQLVSRDCVQRRGEGGFTHVGVYSNFRILIPE